MKIHVVFTADDTIHNDVFICENASRQMFIGGKANIVFRPGPGVDELGRKVISAQYAHASTIYTYVD